MTTLLLRRSTSLKEMRDQLLVHRIPAVLESKRRREKSMVVSFQDALASTCPHFVEVLRVRRCRLGIEPGAVSVAEFNHERQKTIQCFTRPIATISTEDILKCLITILRVKVTYTAWLSSKVET
ncbi:hypothetical protein RHSIM_Rhsim04G0182200 [Rhododendron simsii]|uniref:Uncharacterized protein n=1 Tax=Rhododendron simsii TaxID=118357 RepID=A0A834GZ58_RHOSS|nr:hypothetical protein RHSIM_Rhsim04G0182200 [Rhododendron simsii]